MHYEIKDSKILIEDTSSNNYEYHTQNHIEIIICISGSVDAVCNGTQKHMEKGDLMIVFPHDIHTYNSNSGKVISISFVERISNITASFATHRIYDNFIHDESIIPLATELISQPENVNFSVIFGYLHILIGLIIPNMTVKHNAGHYDTFSKAVQYLCENYKYPVTLQSVAKKVGVTPQYLSKLFSDRIEGGFKYYLSFMRIEKAKRELERHNEKIYEIWANCGFTDQYTFNRTFKNLTGLTPREYRTKYGHKMISII